jgi:hypothetical protein
MPPWPAGCRTTSWWRTVSPQTHNRWWFAPTFASWTASSSMIRSSRMLRNCNLGRSVATITDGPVLIPSWSGRRRFFMLYSRAWD